MRTLLATLLAAASLLAVLAACSGSEPAGSGASATVTASTSGNAATPADANRLAALRADSSLSGFELATQPRQFEFPRDHGPHPSFRHEWWYVTGHLDAATGEPFGFELTFFRFALKPPLLAETPQPASPSAWRTRQIYMAHFAVSDIGRKQFHVAERFARDALGLAGARAEPFRVSLEDWWLGVPELADAQRPATNAPASTQASTAPRGADTWHLVAADKGYSLDLEITPASPIMLNGDAGLSRKSGAEGAASYYYSIPRMSARGRITRDGKPLDVQGTVWLDREWGSGSLGNDQQGWDWYALQLDDGSALMFYALRKRSDPRNGQSDPNGTRDTHSAGTWLAPDGTTRPLTNDDVQIEATNEWTSPRGVRYPARWHLRVRSLNLDVDIQPLLADQELNTSTRYWEGACTVAGTREGRDIRGKAYVELVGYTAR
jgi:predicted secreted hydrolase